MGWEYLHTFSHWMWPFLSPNVGNKNPYMDPMGFHTKKWWYLRCISGFKRPPFFGIYVTFRDVNVENHLQTSPKTSKCVSLNKLETSSFWNLVKKNFGIVVILKKISGNTLQSWLINPLISIWKFQRMKPTSYTIFRSQSGGVSLLINLMVPRKQSRILPLGGMSHFGQFAIAQLLPVSIGSMINVKNIFTIIYIYIYLILMVHVV